MIEQPSINGDVIVNSLGEEIKRLSIENAILKSQINNLIAEKQKQEAENE